MTLMDGKLLVAQWDVKHNSESYGTMLVVGLMLRDGRMEEEMRGNLSPDCTMRLGES